jgi:hypothetical protein
MAALWLRPKISDAVVMGCGRSIHSPVSSAVDCGLARPLQRRITGCTRPVFGRKQRLTGLLD